MSELCVTCNAGLVDKSKKIVSYKLCFDFVDVVYLFCVGGFLGTAYEIILTLCMRGLLEDRSGSILTPFNYVYGVGAVIILLVLYRVRNGWALFVLGSFFGGVVEYALSCFQEVFLGCRSWDYSARPLNIGGRTTVPYMLVWGVLCFGAIRFLFPALLRLMHLIPAKIGKIICRILLIVLAADIALTLAAVVCYVQRSGGTESTNWFTQLMGSVFSDTFMSIHFPNMMIN